MFTHILSNCTVALEQGRFTWRHNSVLSNIISLIRPCLSPGMQLFSDLPGFLAPNGGSIPPHILVTNLKPDIFIVNEATSEVIVFELTCPWDNNIERSHNFKEEKYSSLVSDLSHDFTVFQFSVEVSVRGQLTGSNKARLKNLSYRCCRDPKAVTKSLYEIMSKAALLSSFSIFSRVHATLHLAVSVGRSVGRSVRPSHF